MYEHVIVSEREPLGYFIVPLADALAEASLLGNNALRLLRNAYSEFLCISCMDVPSTGKYGGIALGHSIDKYSTSIVPAPTTYNGEIELILPSVSGILPTVSFDTETSTLMINTM